MSTDTVRQALITELQAEFESRQGEAELLDELVIDTACSMASAVNNWGVDAQIEFLIENGCSAEDIRNAFESGE